MNKCRRCEEEYNPKEIEYPWADRFCCAECWLNKPKEKPEELKEEENNVIDDLVAVNNNIVVKKKVSNAFDYVMIMQKYTVIHCETEEQAIELLDWAHSEGLEWCDGYKYKDDYRHDTFNEKTCYDLFNGCYHELSTYQNIGYVIFNFDDVKK